MNDHDQRIEELLRQGPPEEDGYRLPPFPSSASRLVERPVPARSAPLREVVVRRAGGPDSTRVHAGSDGGRAPRAWWVALAAAGLAVALVGGSWYALASREHTAAPPSSVPAVAQPSPAAGRSASPTPGGTGVPPFPTVGPNATTSSGWLEPGDTAVLADGGGPVMLVRVRGVKSVAAVPGLTPSAPGIGFLEVTIDIDVLRDVPDGPFLWKTIGANEVHTAAWPERPLDGDRLGVGISTWHLGLEAPTGGEVDWLPVTMFTREGPRFRLRPAVATATPSPAEAPGDWVGLEWGEPADLPLTSPAVAASLNAAIAWRGGFVVAGDAGPVNEPAVAVAWYSADGATWTATLVDRPKEGPSTIQTIAAVGDRLVAIGTSGPEPCTNGGPGTCGPAPVAIWISRDGRIWDRQPTPSSMRGVTIVAAASNPTRVLVVGDAGWAEPRIWTSLDGLSWSTVALPGATFGDAHLRAIAAWDRGWLLAGSTGGDQPVCCANDGPTGAAAAWHSADGLTWERGTPSGPTGVRGDLADLHAGSSGAVAVGDLGGEAGMLETIAWATADGASWSATVRPRQDQEPLFVASDGRHILRQGAGSPSGPLAVSADGVAWRDLTASGAAAAAPTGQGGPQYLATVGLTADGLVAAGYRSATDSPVAWIARAVTAP